MKIILKVGILFLKFIYWFYKLFPIKNRIVFVSRQSNTPSVDAILLSKELCETNEEIQVIQEFRCIPDSWTGKIGYIIYMCTRQMCLFATAKVVILDGYCILASVLKHKKELKIIQIWHALGALKKFGYSALGSMEGKDPEVAKILCMHKNYDYVICSSPNCAPYYEEAFNISEDKIVIESLPRVDLITSPSLIDEMKKRIYKDYPELKEKKTILYVPTFRMNTQIEKKVETLIDYVDYNKYNLIVKLHPLTRENVVLGNAKECGEYSALELLDIADYVITDYSAFIFEVAVAGKPLFLYTHDLEEYLERRGFYIDYCKEMPEAQYRRAEEVIKAIENEKCDMEQLRKFAEKYIENRSECSQKLADFISALYNDSINE